MIAGTDEVGRGCLAGPVVAAAVILKEDIPGLTDSKKISPKKREFLADLILEKSFFSTQIFFILQDKGNLNGPLETLKIPSIIFIYECHYILSSENNVLPSS